MQQSRALMERVQLAAQGAGGPGESRGNRGNPIQVSLSAGESRITSPRSTCRTRLSQVSTQLQMYADGSKDLLSRDEEWGVT